MKVNNALPVMETFLTIQGEGANTGKAAYFIRLAGCDVGCSWCDVKGSWDKNIHPLIPIDVLVEKAKQSKVPNVVITGGEPTLYNLFELTDRLQKEGLKTWLETSGTNIITGNWDWICLSPKKFKSPLPEALAAADEFKIIVLNKTDLSWAETMVPYLSPKRELFLQPEWSKRADATALIVNYTKKNPQWRISLQTHKYIDIP